MVLVLQHYNQGPHTANHNNLIQYLIFCSEITFIDFASQGA